MEATRFIRTPAGYLCAPNCTVVGDVTIGKYSSIWFGAVIRGDVAPVQIGQRVNVQDNAVIHCDNDVPNIIEDNVVIGHSAIVHGKHVGEGSLIGMGATLLSRSVVGRRCLVAAGAVVAPDTIIPDGTLVVGVPAKVVRPLQQADLDYIASLAARYLELAERYAEGEFRSTFGRES